MSEWKQTIAKDFCTQVTDGTHDSPKPTEIGFYLITSKHLQPYGIDFSNAYKISELDYLNVIKRSKVEQYDILFSMIGTVGTIYQVKDLHFNYAIKNMGVFKMNGDKAKSDWLYYWLQTQKAKNYIYKQLSGSTQSYLTLGSLRQFPIEYPSKDTSLRITSILSSLDAKIENNNKINAKLEEIAQNLFKEWFVDFGPFKDGKFVESELGMIPEGWRVGTLGEIAEINPSRSIKKDSYSTYLDMKNMPTTGPFPIQWESKTYSGGMKFKNGDTLMARITPCLENGKVAYVNFLNDEEIGFGSTEYIVISPKDEYFPEFFYFLCRDKRFIDYAVANMNGSSGRQRVSGNAICNYSMPIPPQGTINKLTSIKSLMEKIKYNCLENQRLATLRDTLLPKLISGEIKL